MARLAVPLDEDARVLVVASDMAYLARAQRHIHLRAALAVPVFGALGLLVAALLIHGWWVPAVWVFVMTLWLWGKS